MDLEFHQLELRFAHLRVRRPDRERKLLASLAAAGQQVPIVVVAVEGKPQTYLVIDGYKRVSALQKLGRDIVMATVWEMNEPASRVRLRTAGRFDVVDVVESPDLQQIEVAMIIRAYGHSTTETLAARCSERKGTTKVAATSGRFVGPILLRGPELTTMRASCCCMASNHLTFLGSSAERLS